MIILVDPINSIVSEGDDMLNTNRILFLATTALLISLLGTFHARAEETHRIPDAPSAYLEKKNPYNLKEFSQDEKLIKKFGRNYKRKCQKCHGEQGDGLGPRAESFIIKPAAFAKPGYLKERKDGQLFWIIENGSPGTEMPPHRLGSRANLTEDEIWQFITFLRYQFTK
ncbi:MAG: cytochrome c [Magnetococcales bacterium]|nr:cytochrome c [Magnetococcales bacterium]